MQRCRFCGSELAGQQRYCCRCGKELFLQEIQPDVRLDSAQHFRPPHGEKLGFAHSLGRMFGQFSRLPVWALLLLLLIGGSLLTRLLFISKEAPIQNREEAQATATAQPTRSVNKPDNSTAPSAPAERFALDVKKALQAKYTGLDTGVADHVLFMMSDSFKDETVRQAAVTEVLKNRNSLCENGIWVLKTGYTRNVFADDLMDTSSLNCSQEKAERIRILSPKRQKLAMELSDANMHVTVNGDTLIFDSDLFSDFGARAAFLDRMGSNVYYRRLACDSEFEQMQLTHRKQVMRTVPIACN